MARAVGELQRRALELRTTPLQRIVGPLPRMAREIARRAGKRIDVVLRNTEIELDRTILDRLSDPLIHIFRNAVDHGIEAPDVRLAAGTAVPDRVVDANFQVRMGVDGRVGDIAAFVIDVVDEQADLDPAVGGLQRPVEQQLTGEVALPQVVLEVEALLCEVGKAEPGSECLVRMADQAHAGQRAVGRREFLEEATEPGLLRMLPGLAGYLLEAGGDRSARG